MLEVELKYRVADQAVVLARLTALGAVHVGEAVEVDHYFNAPDRDFRSTGEAFRLRRDGASNRFTYKGPKQAAVTKTRTEIELAVADGDGGAADAERLVQALGFSAVAVVKKTRAVYDLPRGDFTATVCLDVVVNVGTFVEVEVVCGEAQAALAEATVLTLAAELGLRDPEPRSYLRMLLVAEGRE
ncbi:class IV adenylate cyclase [Urbifossiella limnaea]|uniref:CYTH domain protein n=1 Tax=Urbifossiella limnaea TaxID=2528023 RepID=A0A517XTE6_9BACT|nr:class IV adenylate cyclase [Urbifossiella limnaea]QDU20800.1 CYTH domain protein [Urbifossiella limnaea]